VVAELPASVDLRTGVAAKDWPIWDQGVIPSCTAHAVAAVALFEMVAMKRTTLFPPSRLFLYYCERVMDHHADEVIDSYVSDGIDVVLKHGFCADTHVPGVVPQDAVWPYSTDAAVVEKRPPESCYAFAKKQRVFTQHRLHEDLQHLLGCLAEGHPFTILINMCTWNRVSPQGDIPMPTPEERKTAKDESWHAMAVVAYDNAKELFIVRNSMGAWRKDETGWGDAGYGTIPYAFVTDKATGDNAISDPYSVFSLRVAKG
jgi:C1A family cysteine protease